jgi:hypothetical protein
VYANDTPFDTPLEDIYGENVPRIRAEIDPDDMGFPGGGSNFDGEGLLSQVNVRSVVYRP